MNYSDLNEASILWNLKLRYGNEDIYVSLTTLTPLKTIRTTKFNVFQIKCE